MAEEDTLENNKFIWKKGDIVLVKEPPPEIEGKGDE